MYMKKNKVHFTEFVQIPCHLIKRASFLRAASACVYYSVSKRIDLPWLQRG